MPERQLRCLPGWRSGMFLRMGQPLPDSPAARRRPQFETGDRSRSGEHRPVGGPPMDAVRTHVELPSLLARIPELGRDVIAPGAGDVDLRARFPRESIAALKNLGLLSAYVPADLGGLGLSIVDVARLCEALGQY